MAKKKPESGPGTFMIIALVFFVLTSAILGVTTYLGFEGQSDLDKQAKEAQAKEKAAKTQADEQIARRNVLRIATATDDPQDREDLRGAAKANQAAVLDEYKRLTDKLGGAALPGGRNQFTWALGPDGEIAPAPNRTIPQIANMWATAARDAETKYKTEQVAHQKTQEAKAAADKRAEDQKATFDQQVADLTRQMKEKTDAMDKAFLALKEAADLKGKDFEKAMTAWANSRAELDERLLATKAQISVLTGRIHRLETADPSDLMARLNRAKPETIAESMGTVRSKDGQFVTVEFGRRIHLLPQQSFIVIASGTSLAAVLEREKELEKNHTENISHDPREPFKGNELVKGMVEITNVTGVTSAQARITYENQQIRNPITRGDQLFNMALSSGQPEHIAYAGIMDLDGDGRDDSSAFQGILKRNNLVVDASLDLKSGAIKGKINPSTQFLILGTGAPMVGNVKKMVDDANGMKIPIVDSRRFLAVIGVKPPVSPAPPLYTGVTLGGEGSRAPKDQDDVTAPPVVPELKKDEPKKDQ